MRNGDWPTHWRTPEATKVWLKLAGNLGGSWWPRVIHREPRFLNGARNEIDGQHFLDQSARQSGFNGCDAFTPSRLGQSTCVVKEILRDLSFHFHSLLIILLILLIFSYFRSLPPLQRVAAIDFHVPLWLFFLYQSLELQKLWRLKMVRVSFFWIQSVWLLRKRLKENSNLILFSRLFGSISHWKWRIWNSAESNCCMRLSWMFSPLFSATNQDCCLNSSSFQLQFTGFIAVSWFSILICV